jgi:hypothetical protein
VITGPTFIDTAAGVFEELRAPEPQWTRRAFESELDRLLRTFAADLDNPGSVQCEGCRRCTSCMFCHDCEECYRCTHSRGCRSSTQLTHCVDCAGCHDCAYCVRSESCTRSSYLVLCRSCSECTYCLGCVGLVKADFHILNVKYTRSEYFRIAKLLGEALGLELLAREPARERPSGAPLLVRSPAASAGLWCRPMVALLAALLVAASPATPDVPAAATPALVLAPAAARPGDAVLIRVTGSASPPRGELAGRRLLFWRDREEWRALAALPIETPVGAVPVAIDAGTAHLEGSLAIVEPGFRVSRIELPPRYVEPPPAARRRMEEDRKAFAKAFSEPFAPPLYAGPFVLPGDAPLSGRYGDQRIVNGKPEAAHYGLDLAAARGAPVTACNDGRVLLVRDAYMSGNTVVIWHGAGIMSVYMHLDRADVKAGQEVRRGQRIGQVGSTGRSTGPHLHWGVKVNGLYVDPESLLAIDFGQGSAVARGPAAPPAAEPASASSPAAAPPTTPAAAPR